MALLLPCPLSVCTAILINERFVPYQERSTLRLLCFVSLAYLGAVRMSLLCLSIHPCNITACLSLPWLQTQVRPVAQITERCTWLDYSPRKYTGKLTTRESTRASPTGWRLHVFLTPCMPALPCVGVYMRAAPPLRTQRPALPGACRAECTPVRTTHTHTHTHTYGISGSTCTGHPTTKVV